MAMKGGFAAAPAGASKVIAAAAKAMEAVLTSALQVREFGISN